MNIKRDCTITLTPEEVQEAFTAFIQEKHKYRSDKVKPFEECLGWGLHPDMQTGKSVVVRWGVPEEPEEKDAKAEAVMLSKSTPAKRCAPIKLPTVPSTDVPITHAEVNAE